MVNRLWSSAVAWAVAVPCCALGAQGARPPVGTAEPIRDNSFLVEEAYNQERGVVQHISTFLRDARSTGWSYAFTQEWPLGGERHQLSFTVPFQHAADGERGLGDVLLNYRFQALGGAREVVYFAPRLSVVTPTGDERRGFGAGAVGVQANLPLSVEVGRSVVTHWNVGATHVPAARGARGEKGTTTSWGAAQSVVWLAHPLLNVLVETVWSSTETVAGPGRTARDEALVVSPGVRGAVNFASGLQIVPGVGLPLGVGPSRGDRSVLAYLSFEHPF